MRDLQETIKILRMRALRHYHATIHIDPCRIVGYFACASLANELDHIHKMETQEDIEYDIPEVGFGNTLCWTHISELCSDDPDDPYYHPGYHP